MIKRGFTIIELVISVVVIAGISVVIARTYLSVTRSTVKIEAIKDIKQNGDFALNVMTQMIHNAKKGSLVCAGNTIQITNFDGGQTTFTCFWESGVTRIASISAVLFSRRDFLTSSALSTTPFSAIPPIDCSGSTFWVTSCIPGVNTPGQVTINFSLYTANVPSGQFNAANSAFGTTVTMRN